MKVPFFGNDRQYQNLQKSLHQAAQGVWETGQYLNGPAVVEFENELAYFCKRKFALALGSCTDALTFSLQALNLEKGSEVLVTNFSFLSSATAILKAGLTPIFCDINCDSMMSSAEIIAQNITKKTKAVIAVSLFGSMAALDDIEELCRQKNIPLIEDAAQSLGAILKDRPAASFGIASTVSFDPTKLLHGTGAGGALLTDDPQLYSYVKTLRLHGRDEEGDFIRLGNKSLLSSHDAAILRIKLKYLPQWIKERQEIAHKYTQAIEENPHLTPQIISPQIKSTFHKYVLRCDSKERRDTLRAYLTDKGIITRIHYPKLISDEVLFNGVHADTPHAKELTQTIITLPLFQELTPQEVHYTCDCLSSF